jgi:hypothetical protein
VESGSVTIFSSLNIVYQANYINALAVSVLPFFEPAKPITLGESFIKTNLTSVLMGGRNKPRAGWKDVSTMFYFNIF